MVRKKAKKIKKGSPSYINNDVVMSWAYGKGCYESVPAIEQCRIAVVKFPVSYYVHVDYGPELMNLRRKRIVELGWKSDSLDLPRPPVEVGQFSLLSHAIKAVNATFEHSEVYVNREYPSTIDCTSKNYGKRSSYCRLYFDQSALEFYNLLFKIGTDGVPFENLPTPKLNTLNQMLKWSKSFEVKRRKLYKTEGFTWEPFKSELSETTNTNRR